VSQHCQKKQLQVPSRVIDGAALALRPSTFKEIAMATTAARLNYFHDTLFGPIAKSIDCNLVITPITPGAFQVQVHFPVPDDLHKANSLVIILSSKEHLTGSVAQIRKLDDGGLEFQIDV
jgi:hypothetical protein